MPGTPVYGIITLNTVVTDTTTSATLSGSFSITVNSLTVSVDPQAVPQGMVNMPYTFNNVTYSGATTPVTITYSNTPSGLSGNSSGQLVGTPNSSGTTTVTVKVTDSSTPTNQIGTTTFQLPVVAETSNTLGYLLSGQYACNLERYWDGGISHTSGGTTYTLYRGGMVMAFTANGVSAITGGESDSNTPGTGYKYSSGITGTYAIGSDMRGYITIGSGPSIFAIVGTTISNGVFSELDIVEMDDTGNSPSGKYGSGHCYLQNTSTALNTFTPSGGYVFLAHGEDNKGNPEALAGQINFSGSNATVTIDEVVGTTLTANTTTTDTFASPDTYGRMSVSYSGSPVTIIYITNDTKGNGVIMGAIGHDATTGGDFLIGQTRIQNATNIAASYPLKGNQVMYMNGPVVPTSGSVVYKAFAAQINGSSTGSTQISVKSVIKNANGTFAIDSDSSYGKTVTYTASSSTGRTTLSGLTGDVLYLYNTNSAAVLFADTSSGNTQALIGWIEPQSSVSSWAISDLATTYAMAKLPNLSPNSSGNEAVFTIDSTGAMNNFAQDDGEQLWASWEDPFSGTPTVTATGAVAINTTAGSGSDGASYGLIDINATSSGSTSTIANCFAITVDATTSSSSLAKLVCVDASGSNANLSLVQESLSTVK